MALLVFPDVLMATTPAMMILNPMMTIMKKENLLMVSPIKMMLG